MPLNFKLFSLICVMFSNYEIIQCNIEMTKVKIVYVHKCQVTVKDLKLVDVNFR